VAASVRTFIAENQTVVPASAAAVSGNVKAAAPKRMAYGARAAQAANPAGAPSYSRGRFIFIAPEC